MKGNTKTEARSRKGRERGDAPAVNSPGGFSDRPLNELVCLSLRLEGWFANLPAGIKAGWRVKRIEYIHHISVSTQAKLDMLSPCLTQIKASTFQDTLYLFLFSSQILVSTPAWPQVPAEKLHGAPSWKSKVLCGFPNDRLFSPPDILFLYWLSFSSPSEAGALLVVKNRDESELPGPPSKPQVTDVTKNSVSLSWQPGLPGASAISSYVIEAFRYELFHVRFRVFHAQVLFCMLFKRSLTKHHILFNVNTSEFFYCKLQWNLK